jgi:uncharacterized protein (TIGR00162 family)
MEDITVTFLKEGGAEEIGAPVLVEGLPGVGHVGKLVAEYLIDMLGAERIAEIHSIFFPPQVFIDEHGTARLVRNEIFRYEGDGRKVLFLVGDHQSTSGEGHYILVDEYLDIAEDLGVRRIYTLGGFGVGHLVEEPRVLGAVNQPDLREEIEHAGAVFSRDEPGGGIVGAAGLLLGLGALRGMEGVCLMGETSGYLVDPKSAASVLAVLCPLLGITVDPTRLQQRAAEMEQVIAAMMESEEKQGEDELRYIG